MVDKLKELIDRSNGVVVLTGAGISTDSGIPDFRSEKDGLWNKIDPMTTLSLDTLRRDPARFYEYFFKVFDIGNAQPNRGHIALAELEAKGVVKAITTQNIDGLHQAAGSKNVFEAHGTMRTCHCGTCKEHFPMDILKSSVDNKMYHPECPSCHHGTLRPDVILFGDMLPDWYYEDIPGLVAKNDLLITVGTSLTVYPVAQLAYDCKLLAVINRDDTPFDSACTLRIRDSISDVLSELNKRY